MSIPKFVRRSPIVFRVVLFAMLGAVVLAGVAFGRDVPLRSSVGAATGVTPRAGDTTSTAQSTVISQRTQDSLTRTSQALTDVQKMQSAARAAAQAAASSVPDGLTTGGLQAATGANAKWVGANQAVETAASGKKLVTIKQNQQQALLNWETFNIGKNTTLTFDQSSGGSDVGTWIVFNKIIDPSGNPSQILGSLKADGQVYLINQNGIIFGGASQVNTHALVVSSLPINDNLISRGLTNNPDLQFLFSSLPIDKLSDGTMDAFTPPDAPNTSDGKNGDIVVEAGAQLSSPTTADHVGGKIALIGSNVRNAGTLSTPDGQTILAAGQQVGLSSHSSDDATLRGLDVTIGQGAGVVENSAIGIIDTPRGNTTLAAKEVKQLGVIDSTTSVSLNGSIVLQTDYNATRYKVSDTWGLYPKAAGTVVLGANSVTRILPEWSSSETVVGSQLALSSFIDIEGQEIYLGANAQVLAPSGEISLNAGTWQAANNAYSFFYNAGQIYLDAGATINVAGSEDVSASVKDNIVSVELRGSELADSPTQRSGILRGITVKVDSRQTATYNGKTWVGTPLADVSGYIDLVEHTVGQLTTSGGSVTLNAGDSIVMQAGSNIDVSGGWLQYKGGMVQTSRLISGGNLFNISQANPDITYDGVYSGFTTSHARWNISETYTSKLLSGLHYESGYIEGGNAGTIALTSPAMALDGNLYGNTVTGPRQRSSAPTSGILSILFENQNATTTYSVSPTPPNIFFQSGITQAAVADFSLENLSAVVLDEDRKSRVFLSPDLLNENGFGTLTLVNNDGNITLPSDVSLNTSAGGVLTLSAANIAIEGKITIPGGSLSLTTYDYSPYSLLYLNYLKQSSSITPPSADLSRGLITLGPTASLNVAGLLVDDRIGASSAETLPLVINGAVTTQTDNGSKYTIIIVKKSGKTVTRLVTDNGSTTIKNYAATSVATNTSSDTGKTTTVITLDDGTTNGEALQVSAISTNVRNGGSVTLTSYSANLMEGSAVNASGGLTVGGNGKQTYGNGGSISISAGRDANITSLLGGSLTLDANLEAYAGFGGTGGKLSLLEPLIQIGGNSANALSPEFFNEGGFSSFSLNGIGISIDQTDVYLPGLSVAPGTLISLESKNRYAVRTGETWDWKTVLLPQGSRSAVSLKLGAVSVKDYFYGNLKVRGDMVIGENSVIQTDPSGSVSLNGDTVVVLGKISAPGGTISVSGGTNSTILFSAFSSKIVPTVDIGPNSVLSVAGTVMTTPYLQGYRTGSVLSGGKIAISGNIVAEAGSVLDSSGASGVLDYQRTYSDASSTRTSLMGNIYKPTYVESDGGSITLSGAQELFLDSVLIGNAGGKSAKGGNLTISSGYYLSSVDPTPLDINLHVTQSGATIPVSFYSEGQTAIGHPVVDANGNFISAAGYFTADTFNLGGFDALTLQGVVKFSGNVTLTAPGSLTIATSVTSGVAGGETNGGIIYGDSLIRLNAPYVAIGTAFQTPQQSSEIQSPFWDSLLKQAYAVFPTYGTGNLSISASLIDIGYLSLQNIGKADFIAANGDIRGDGVLDIAGNITMTAGQIYPATAVSFTIAAYDYTSSGASGKGTVTLNASGVRQLPFSAGGTLSIYGSVINQGGVLRAPIGTINIGWDGSGTGPVDLLTTKTCSVTQTLTLLPGSITSVSAIDPITGRDLTIPYGINVNGSAWIDPAGVNITSSELPSKSINLAGVKIDDQAGSVVDIRGGGDLYAYQFVKGTGGSTDILNSTTSFAIIPSYSSDYAPYASYNTSTLAATNLGTDKGYTNSSLKVGDVIYLEASDGLYAGYYTLLPARYALLSGAYLITPKSGVPAANGVSLSDGSQIVSGYRVNSLNAGRVGKNLYSRYEIASSAVVRSRAQYDDYSANSFIGKNSSTARLPVDSGRLVLQASAAMSLKGSVWSQPKGSSGRGGMVDINSPVDIVIAGAGAVEQEGKLVLNASELSAFGAESLLIGGVRSDSGETISVKTDSLTVDNAGSPLTGPDIILVANKNLTLAPNAEICQVGEASAMSGLTIEIKGSTQLKSSGDSITLPQAGSTLLFPSGTPGNDKIISTTDGTITSNGTTLVIKANTPTTIPAGASVQFAEAGTVSFASGGTGGAIPITLGDGLLLRVSSDPSSQIKRSNVSAYAIPKMMIGAGAKITGKNVVIDSTYATALDSKAVLNGKILSLNSGQISVQLDGAGDLKLTSGQPTTGLVLSSAAMQNLVASVQSLSLLSYSSIDIYGEGSVGSSSLEELQLHASELRGFNNNGGTGTFSAKKILLDNSVNGLMAKAVDGQSSTLAGTLAFNAGTLEVGANNLRINQFSDVVLNATSGLLFKNTGNLQIAGNLMIQTPLIAGATAASQTVTVAGALEIKPTQSSVATVTAGLGASLTLQGQSIHADSTILLPSGSLKLHATGGDVVVNSRLDVAGTERDFFDVKEYTSGGQITLISDSGNVKIDGGAILSVAAQAGAGDAGILSVTAPMGAFSLDGKLLGAGGSGGGNGTFLLDVGSQANLGSLDAMLNAASFDLLRSYRVRTGDVVISGEVKSHAYNVSADQGSITVAGNINASGDTGGSIALEAYDQVTLQVGSILNVEGADFDHAGKGGAVSIESSHGWITLAEGSTIKLGVLTNTDPAANAVLGKLNGTLHLRALQNTAGNDVQINSLDGEILNASSILVEGYKTYDLTLSGGEITDTVKADIYANGLSFLGTGYDSMLNRLLGADNTGLESVLVIAPGAEVINRTGDLTLSSDWDLSSYRFGPKGAPGVLTLRAAGDLIFNGALSDGFDSSSYQARLISENTLLPVNTQSWSYRLTAGADFSAADFRKVLSAAVLGNLGGSLKLGKFCNGYVTNPQYRETPDTWADDIQAALDSAISGNYQVIRTGSGDIDIFTGGDVQLRNQFATIYTAGTKLDDPTMGGQFDVPMLWAGDLVTEFYAAEPQYSRAGGNVTIHAQGNISHITQVFDSNGNNVEVSDSERELPNNWLYRSGYVDESGNFGTALDGSIASTTWWVNFSNFFEGVGALGGGNLVMTAEGDINNVDAVVPTNARMPKGTPDANKLVELGGGDLTVKAGGDINGGVYYIEKGNGVLHAGGSIALHTDNLTRSPYLANIEASSSYSVANSMDVWLPTTLFLGKGSFDISANGDVTLGPVANPFLLPQSFFNTFWDKTYFCTYAPTDTVNVRSLMGTITLKEGGLISQNYDELNQQTASGLSTLPMLGIWMQKQLLFTTSNDTAAFYQPWLALVESSVDSFETVDALMPSTLKVTAFSGNIDIVGSLTLSPSPTGSLDLLAAGNINGLQVTGASKVGKQQSSLVNIWTSATINLSDADPSAIPGITNPLAYRTIVGDATGDGYSELSTEGNFLYNKIGVLFDETGSYTGQDAALQSKQALHDSDILHANDSDPVHLYAETGNISGFTLYSSKVSKVMAGLDLTDVSLYIQNVNTSDISLVSAGRDILAFDSTLASGDASYLGATAEAGDFQISGPGTLEVLAGRNLDLGDGSNVAESLGMGLTSIGNSRNPYLPFAGADIIAGAGIDAAGLDESSMDFKNFISRFVDPQTGGATATRCLLELGATLGLIDLTDPTTGKATTDVGTNLSKTQAKVTSLGMSQGLTYSDVMILINSLGDTSDSTSQIQARTAVWNALMSPASKLTSEQQDKQKQILALNAFYIILRDAGRDHQNSTIAGYGNYDAGYAAIKALFPGSNWKGDVSLTSREIKTKNGGDISLFAPGGKITVGYDISGTQPLDQGILTEHGGNISIFTRDSVIVGTSRIFTLRGGNEIIWSTLGNIAAGTSSKTVQSAPPTRVMIDPQSADVKTDLAGLATGGGIGALETVKDIPASDIDLIAPSGSVDAGDAGIRATGNLNVAAVQVLNASNIQVGGATNGTPVVAASNIGSIQLSAQTTTTSVSSAGAEERAAAQRRVQQQQQEELPSIFNVEVLGYGGGEG